MKTSSAMACVQSETENRKGDSHITEEKAFVFAWFHNISSVSIRDPTLNSSLKCFGDNSIKRKLIIRLLQSI